MDFFVWQRTCVDEAGNVLPSASVTVTDVVSGALAQLYSDPAGSVGIGNPITADSEGFVQFYVKAGFYNITATSGSSSRTWTREAIGAPHPRTAAEISAGVTPVDYRYPELHVYRYGTNTTPGTTDMTDAIHAAVNVAKQRGGGVVQFPDGDIVAHSDTIGIDGRVRIDLRRSTLLALSSFPSTIDSDKFGGAAGFTIHAPQILVDLRGQGDNCSFNVVNGFLDGDDVAPVGLTVVQGANVYVHSVHATKHAYANFVIDGPQNSAFVNLRASRAPTNLLVLNVTQHCTFIACNGRAATADVLRLDEDSNYPSYRIFTGIDGPARCSWINCIYEGAPGADTFDRVAYIGAGTSSCNFLNCGFSASGDTLNECLVEIGSNTGNIKFDRCTFHGSAPQNLSAGIKQNGFQVFFYEPYFQNITATNMMECGSRTIIVHPHYSAITATKHVASLLGGDPRVISYTPMLPAGSGTQLPTENVDSYYTFFETTTDNLLVWDFNAQNWQNVTRQSATAAQLADAGHAINTLAKYEGKMVYDTTNNVPLWAAGSAPTSVWQDLINGGSGDITPS